MTLSKSSPEYSILYYFLLLLLLLLILLPLLQLITGSVGIGGGGETDTVEPRIRVVVMFELFRNHTMGEIRVVISRFHKYFEDYFEKHQNNFIITYDIFICIVNQNMRYQRVQYTISVHSAFRHKRTRDLQPAFIYSQ